MHSKTILRVHSNVSYLSVTKACSRAGGYHCLRDNNKDPLDNVSIHNVCKIMINIMALAAEAEIRAYFINTQDAVPERTTLIEMGHPQPPTRIQVYNTTANVFANKTLKQKRYKAINIRF